MSQYKYVTMPRGAKAVRSSTGYYDYAVGDQVLMADSCTVMETDKSPLETGLLDAHGNPLYRMTETVKLGFHLG